MDYNKINLTLSRREAEILLEVIDFVLSRVPIDGGDAETMIKMDRLEKIKRKLGVKLRVKRLLYGGPDL